jgi:hypothetical protein
MTDAVWYRLLTAAQGQWFATMAAIIPEALFSAPQMLESDDGGLTYTFGNDVDGRALVPYAVRGLFRTEADARRPDWFGRALVPGADFTIAGDRVWMPETGALAFADGGPWAVYVAPPGVIDATHEPTLLPLPARELLVLTAVEAWATQGGLRDPGPFIGRAGKLWSGGGTPGDVGLLGALRGQYFNQAAAAAARGGRRVSRLAYWGAR